MRSAAELLGAERRNLYRGEAPASASRCCDQIVDQRAQGIAEHRWDIPPCVSM
jgi:hypothetical protein